MPVMAEEAVVLQTRSLPRVDLSSIVTCSLMKSCCLMLFSYYRITELPEHLILRHIVRANTLDTALETTTNCPSLKTFNYGGLLL